MFGRIGVPELLILIGVAAVLFAAYRMGYNAGYRRALEKQMDRERPRG